MKLYAYSLNCRQLTRCHLESRPLLQQHQGDISRTCRRASQLELLLRRLVALHSFPWPNKCCGWLEAVFQNLRCLSGHLLPKYLVLKRQALVCFANLLGSREERKGVGQLTDTSLLQVSSRQCIRGAKCRH